MTFEFRIIKRYLLPTKKNLSSALIANISIFTIALTVWLLVVFLSVLKSVEQNWIEKLTTLQAPIRIIPNELYYQSPYFRPESLTYSPTLLEKSADPDLDQNDPVAGVLALLKKRRLEYDPYEVCGAVVTVHLSHPQTGSISDSTLTQASYLSNPMIHSKSFQNILIPPDPSDRIEKERLNRRWEHYARLENGRLKFPEPLDGQEPVLLPKNFKDSMVRIGDPVDIHPQHTSSLLGAKQVIKGYVCGFYDPGLLSIGTRVIFLRSQLIDQLSLPEVMSSFDPLLKGGFFVYVARLSQVFSIVGEIKKEPVMRFFDVIPYTEFPFAKEVLHQFKADQLLFSLIGMCILLIACLNIIAALILVVQEKKEEIGLMMALGASRLQIQRIFGLLGFFIGLTGFAFGASLAYMTLANLEWLVSKLLFLQGHPVIKVLNIQSGGSAISYQWLLIVCLITPLLAMIAGLIPAKKALQIQPVEILKNG